MKISISTMTTNRQFVKSLRRLQGVIEGLKRRLKPIIVQEFPYDLILIAFVDKDSDFCQVISGADGMFEFEVGYDFKGSFPSNDDVLVIQLLEEKLMKIIQACGLPEKDRSILAHIIEDWTTEAIMPTDDLNSV